MIIQLEKNGKKFITHTQIGLIHLALSLFFIIIQLIVFSGFYLKKSILKNSSFRLIWHHGVLSLSQQICHIITSIIIIFCFSKLKVIILIVGSLLNATYIGGIAILFILTVNRFDKTYHLDFFYKTWKKKFFIFALIICYICVGALFLLYLLPGFRYTFNFFYYYWQLENIDKNFLAFQIENKSKLILLVMIFILQILIIAKIIYLRCYISKKFKISFDDFKIIIHTILCIVTATFREVALDGELFQIKWTEFKLTILQFLYIFCSNSNNLFILFFVK
uniref:7TM GPCR serpentine receptor class x (Srx) domain-containing protein n=1 Tax=Strongyloides stercoralis TaxID=6248 RepID=A0A0K0EA53_STRER